MLRLSVRKKLLVSYLLTGFPLALLIIYSSYVYYSKGTNLIQKNANFLIIGFFSAFLLSLISSAIITKPLSLLRKYADNVANLNFQKIKPIKSGDDFELIFEKFNHMNKRLQGYIKNFNDKNKELEAVIANMQNGILISDDEGKITIMNKSAKNILGWCKCAGKSHEICLPYLYQLSGEATTTADSPIKKALLGLKYSSYLLEAQNPKTNKKLILNFSGTPLKNDKGHIYGTVVIFSDITKQYRMQERLRRMVNFEKIKSNHLSILHEVSLNLNAEKDIDKIQAKVLKAAVAITEAKNGIIVKKDAADYYVSDSFRSEGNNLAEGLDISDLRKLFKNKLFKDRKTFRIANYAKLKPPGNGHVSIKALMHSPIFCNKQTIAGRLILFNKKNGHRFSLEDEKVTQILTAHATVAITNAINYEREHKIAQVLQKSLLPTQSFAKSLIPNVEISLAYKPATQGALVGGDFYDFIELGNDRTACLIADVNGKGVEAAAITSLAKSTIKAFTYEGYAPDKVLEKTNKVLFNQTDAGVFITAVYGILDLENGYFEYANAGHHPPLLYREEQNSIVTLNQGSTPLGILQDESYELHIIDLRTNDCLVLYTDGLIEARKNKDLYGEDRLIQNLLANASSEDAAQKILAEAEDFAGGNITDDIAIAALKIMHSNGEHSFEKRVSLWVTQRPEKTTS